MRRVDPCIYPRFISDVQVDQSPEHRDVDFFSTHSTGLPQFLIKLTRRYLGKGAEMEPKIYTTSKDSRIITQDTTKHRLENNVRPQAITVAGPHQSCDSNALEPLFGLSGTATYGVDVTIRAQQHTLISIHSPIKQEVELRDLHHLAMNVFRRAGETHMAYPRDADWLILWLASVSGTHRIWRTTATYCWIFLEKQSFHCVNESGQQQVTPRAHTDDYLQNLLIQFTQYVARIGSFNERVTAGERVKNGCTT